MASTPKLSRRGLIAAGAALAVAGLAIGGASAASAQQPADRSAQTQTPIKHVVVIFGENVSYDHYYGTYPQAANTDGTTFTAAAKTPRNDNLVTSGALTSNPNVYLPSRLTPAQAATCDQNHAYTPEQKAVNGGAMDRFVQSVSVDTCTGLYGAPGLAMDYYDGNTVAAMWNYAQNYAMSDNSWDATFGPSTPGALNLISGQTHGFTEVDSKTLKQVATPGSYTLADPNAAGVGTVINDPDPAYDDCSDKNHTSTNTLAAGQGKNVGDLLNAKGVTWGWFQGGFRPTTSAGNGATYSVCGATHTNLAGASVVDYSPHHNPFAYYASTSNPHHVAPSSVAMIGKTDQANHNYDLTDFDAALAAGRLPAVSFLKASEYQDGHAGYSDPIDEQHFIVNEINALQKSKDWASTAVVISYDDSDGWYDHVAPAISNASHSAAHDLAVCSSSTAPTLGGYADRCGPSQRLPLVVISPYAKTNFIAHNETSQPSILKFIEDNWKIGRVGDSSFDATAGSLNPMFEFGQASAPRVLLNADGSVQSVNPSQDGDAQ
ncbi:phospholipase C [Microbacterium sp. ASV49]|uniref:phospholipase C n=1 Tax=Microbacterium candidum TaxID=3041922 RepID=A0ABT7MUI5_9MICO|nr:alkaline phosphatase family protein [Microbacterium sp. ASV49]MDL9978110.1 alkaline phosphatase family protein [Microbacterium sp. ASV49]